MGWMWPTPVFSWLPRPPAGSPEPSGRWMAAYWPSSPITHACQTYRRRNQAFAAIGRAPRGRGLFPADLSLCGADPEALPSGTICRGQTHQHRYPFFAFHQLPTDEVYHYYLGDPAELFELHPDGTTRLVTLGADIVNGHQVQHVVPRGTWQASRVAPGGEWALLGTTMAPGYTQSDFLLGYAASLIKKYPSQEQIIRQLTRDE